MGFYWNRSITKSRQLFQAQRAVCLPNIIEMKNQLMHRDLVLPIPLPELNLAIHELLKNIVFHIASVVLFYARPPSEPNLENSLMVIGP